jgi:Right handed beta helix region
MFRKTLARGMSLSLALCAAGLIAASGASADTIRIRASDFRQGTLSFQVPGDQSITVRSARLKSPRGSTRPSLAAVRRGMRRGTVRVRASKRSGRRLRALGPARRDRLVRRHSLVIHGKRHGQTPPPEPPTEPEPPDPPTEPVPAGAYYVSPTGSDANPGTATAPWLTLKRAVTTAEPGDTVVLRAGTYGARGTTHQMNEAGTASAPITYRGYPGEAMPRILGHFRISASYQRFSGLLFDGPTGSVKTPTTENPAGEQVQVSINGSAVNGIEISRSEIRNSDWHAGIFLAAGRDIRIVGNHIHGNGNEDDPGQFNQSHGIYWHSGSGLISNNVIENNLARGVQLYQTPTDVIVANNTIVKNGKAGIQFAAGTSDSIAVNNIVADNEYGIRTSGLSGTGNVARNNMLWDNSRGNLALTDGLSLSANAIANAQFMGAGDYRLQATSPAIDAAVPSFAPADDFASLARGIGAGPDLGAFEAR